MFKVHLDSAAVNAGCVAGVCTLRWSSAAALRLLPAAVNDRFLFAQHQRRRWHDSVSATTCGWLRDEVPDIIGAVPVITGGRLRAARGVRQAERDLLRRFPRVDPRPSARIWASVYGPRIAAPGDRSFVNRSWWRLQ